ncbi:hypothetical protein LP417_35150 (plasmid) [Polaromonas sp. P1-6]|nr:hypothetical protein LP417_35150 [Polaromonas sp. P1-6]
MKGNMMASILRDSANQRAAQSRLPVSGKIRPGTKTISKNAAQNPLALALFNKAKQGLISFKDAEKEISDKLNIKFPFYPTNTQHFNVYPHDVEGGKNTVDLILGKYGEMRDGDTEQKLYSFPVVFPDLPNGIEGIFPSEYRVDAGAVKYHSAYGDDGVRRCLYLKAVDAKEQATRKKWLRRTESVRGECNPSSCSEFSKGQCRFNGTLQFYIPGVTGSGAFSMRTGSTYAAEDIFVRLEELYKICNGVLPKFDTRGNPVFTITKMKKTRNYFDETGKEKISEQWVLVIETSIEMSKVIYLEERKRLQLAPSAPVPSAPSAPSTWLATIDYPTGQVVGNAGSGNVVDASAPMSGADSLIVNAAAVAIPGVAVTSVATATEGQGARPSAIALTPDAAVQALMDLSDGQELEIWDWAQAKFGPDWDETQPVVVHGELMAMIDTMGVDCVRPYLLLLTVLYANKIPVKELAFLYLKSNFSGSFRDKAVVTNSLNHINELLKSGTAVAIAHMENKIKKAA